MEDLVPAQTLPRLSCGFLPIHPRMQDEGL